MHVAELGERGGGESVGGSLRRCSRYVRLRLEADAYDIEGRDCTVNQNQNWLSSMTGGGLDVPSSDVKTLPVVADSIFCTTVTASASATWSEVVAMARTSTASRGEASVCDRSGATRRARACSSGGGRQEEREQD